MNSTTLTPPEEFLETVLPLAQGEQWKALRSECMARVEDGDQDPVVWYLAALAAFADNELAEAASTAARSLETRTPFAEAADLVAITHGLAGDLNTALYYAKLAVALPTRPELKSFLPPGYPSFAEVLKTVEPDRLVTRAKAAMGMGRMDVAENFLRQHVAFFPDDENAMLLVAVCSSARSDHFGAADWLRGTVHRRQASPNLLSALAAELTNLGCFDEARAVHSRACRLAPEDPVVNARAVFDAGDDPAVSSDALAGMARVWGERFSASAAEWYEPSPQPAKPMNVGVVLSELPGSPAGAFLAQMLSRANPAEFRLVAYGFGTLNDAENHDFQPAVSEWYNTSELDPETLADMFRAESLDAVIDAAGFVSPPTLAALGSRCAARQVLWRNAPYGAALPAVDALLSDEVLDAAPGAAPLHSTVTLRLGTALAQLPPSEEPLFTSSPREQVAFGADISLRQLSSETAAWWAELLCAVPHSTLVLRDRYFRHSKATDRLISMFGDFGVSHRVELISAETDADFWANADIGLMATRAVVPQRAVDVLWGGLPVLVPLLPERGSREVASLLHHVGLAELVADSPAGFAELGARWARDADARAQFHLSIRDRLSQSPVFDPEARAQDLWQALRQLFQ